MLFNKLLYIAHDKNEQYDGGQDEAYINTRPLRELHTLAGIGFLNEALPAPAIAAGTEQQVSQASQGKQVIGDDEILQILNRGACAQRSNCAPDIEAENTGQGEQQDRNEVDRNSFFPGPSEQIDGKA